MSKQEIARFIINIPAELKERVRERANREGRTMTDIIIEYLNEYAQESDVLESIKRIERRLDLLEKK